MSREPSPIRTYAVEIDGVPGFRLVRARSQAQSRNHVAAEHIRVRLATFDDGTVAAEHGIKVEQAVDPLPAAAPAPLLPLPAIERTHCPDVNPEPATLD